VAKQCQLGYLEKLAISMAVFRHCIGYLTFLLPLIAFLLLPIQAAEQASFRRLFSRNADHRLSAIVVKQNRNSTLEGCAGDCVKEADFQCKSFDFDNTQRACLLYSVSVEDEDVYLIANPGRDHYNPAYTTLFHRLPNHMLTTRHNRRIDDVTVEECARRCILETYFKCRGFDYELRTHACWLTELTTERAAGVQRNNGWDYYERTPEGALARFVNYGFGHMQQLAASDVYQDYRMEVGLDSCATLCLHQTTFNCASFDYFFDRDGKSVCYMSKYIAANVLGLVTEFGTRSMHFEKSEEYLDKFYAVPYTVVLGNNHKTYTRVTPNRCALMCLQEEAFVCRSFDYKVVDGTCLLSSKTGSDVGGLYTQGMDEVHHFEMKPQLDCGGDLSNAEGGFASPNWPRNYAHHEDCTWQITVQKHKVIKFHFTHLDLGLRTQSPCARNDDRVTITESVPGGEDSLCVLPNTRYFSTRSNQAEVKFYTNSNTDGQGFRVFYTAEWPCDVLFTSAPGELASPNWPEDYPANTRCSWRVTAPDLMRVYIRFSTFELEQNELGHCNEKQDHMIILNGGTVSSPRIGLYCGSRAPFTVRSTGRDMFIQFKSDGLMMRPGFHATFQFETQNGTLIGGGNKEEFIPLDEEVMKKGYYGETVQPGMERRQYDDGVNVAPSSDQDVPHYYKATMFAVIFSLLILLVLALVAIYLLWKRTRGGSQNDEAREITAEEVPLHVSSINKRNNDLQPYAQNGSLHGNEIDLTVGACAKGDTASFANLLYADISRKDNIKNCNLDSKC